MSTKTKTILRRILITALALYIVFLLGPIAGFDVPAIAARVESNPIQLIQYLIIGVANGAILAIIALGYTMVYGIIELINFAHGDVYMFGVFASLTTLSLTGTLNSTDPVRIILGIALALVVAVVFCAVVN